MQSYHNRQALLIYVVAIIALFVTCLLLTSCASLNPSVPSLQSKDVAYNYDLKGTVNGVEFDGVGVIPAASIYTMAITSRVDVDLLTISSCHHDFHQESAIQVGWLKPKRSFTYNYTPNPDIENTSCLVRIGSYNKAQQQNAWGIIDFETPDSTLPATNLCNGQTILSNGVSICQARTSSIQELKFPTPVEMSTRVKAGCTMPTPVDKMTWLYEQPAGECVIYFRELTGSKRLHRHTTIGYDQILIRGE